MKWYAVYVAAIITWECAVEKKVINYRHVYRYHGVPRSRCLRRMNHSLIPSVSEHVKRIHKTVPSL